LSDQSFKNIPDDSISGDKIHGGEISSFSSTGISDLSSKTTLTVTDGRIIVDAVRTNSLEGNITVNGSITVQKHVSIYEDSIFHHNLTVGNDIIVQGELRVPTLYADKIITKTKLDQKDPVIFSIKDGGIDNKGLIWKRSDEDTSLLVYKKDPDRLFTNLDIDLYRDNSYHIDGTSVITKDTLGPTVIKSSLRKLGRLSNLIVDGEVSLGEHFFYNPLSNRIGIGTDKASAALSLVDEGIEFVIGTLEDNVGNFGTFTSHDLGIITDGVTRVKISRTGRITFGDPKASNADVIVNGKLFVKELIIDKKNERSDALDFKAEPNTSNYGKGMIFTGDGITKQFVLAAQPDQLYSTENINIQRGKSYYINRNEVLSETELGNTVTKSSLTELGTLKFLTVDGTTSFSGVLGVVNKKVYIGKTLFDTSNGLNIIGENLKLTTNDQTISLSNDYISFGDKDSPNANVIVNGKLGVGIQKISNDAQFEVAGNIRFTDKLFAVGSQAPKDGNYKQGDIVWNDSPKETGYVGWVCIRSGNPGIWRGFGQVGVE